MKQIEVVAAIIRKDDKIFATQRGYGEWKDWWEFPGGKIEPGEAPEDALKREIREELATEIKVEDLLTRVEYDYPHFHLIMHCYLCSIKSGQLSLLEHEDARWLTTNENKVRRDMSEKQKYIDFEAYERVAEPHKRERVSAWRTAIGLQDVDGLRVSDYLKNDIC